jgi:uncharacterized membrane protein YbhN (UPF0104 family)
MNSSFGNKLLIGLGLGFAIYVAIAFLADVDDLAVAGGQFNWWIFPVVLALAFGNYLVRFLRWHRYLRRVAVSVTLAESATVFFAGLAMSVTPGKFGELLKAQYIKNINGTNRRLTAPVIVAERLTDLIGVLFLASFGVFSLNYGTVVFFAVFGVIAAAVVVISSRPLALIAIRLMAPLPVIGKRAHKLEEAYDSMSSLMHPASLLPATLLAIAAWGCEATGFWLVINAFPGQAVGYETAFFIYAFAILVGAVSMLPGGLGATEGTMAGLLLFVQVPGARAVAATLITRLATLWFAVLIGLIVTLSRRRLLEGNTPAAAIDMGGHS